MHVARYFIFVVLIRVSACKEDASLHDLLPSNDCTVEDFTPVAGKYAGCLPLLDTTTLDIATWNIENFPKKDGATIALLTEIISTLDADIIAFQEITSARDFTSMISSVKGWSSVVSTRGSQRVGYAYKTTEVTVGTATALFTDDKSAFPRAPLMLVARHISGKEVTLINLHLKCCDDGNSIPRRKAAAQKLKEYIDQNLSDASVVVLGDMNEDITQPEGNDVFTPFVNDSTDYRFTDMNIAACSEANWSYPSYPSHLDHILVTNELFNNVAYIRTLKPATCDVDYFSTVTDHCPVLMRLKF
jgi:endonuclease/exonuclease/phosphatase family metal-dependent hydrolase